ncbi:MAG: hypothetical protein WA304_08735 [Candidatus Cybelea sp.]
MISRTRIVLAAAALSAAALLVAGLSACGNGASSEPPQTSYDPAATSKVQFAVGVATLSYNSGQSVAYGLNEVETLRQRDGLSGTLYNVPMIIGPSKFAVLISTETGVQVQNGGNDVGTNHITWGTLNNSNWIGAHRGGPKQATSGAFGYGLCACNSDSGPPNGITPLYVSYDLPIYGDDSVNWYGGPPAFPQEGPSVIALGWNGYSLGFTDFAVAPVLGTYHLYAAVPPAYDTPQNPTPSPNPDQSPTAPPGILVAGAQLTSLKALPQFATPTFTPDRKGGGSIGVTVPAGATEAMAVVYAVHGGNGTCGQAHQFDSYYTIVTHNAGAQKVTLADNLGPLTQSGKATPTICNGESYDIYAAAMDYPAYEASYPNNLSQLPLIKGPSGQADVSTSDKLFGTYPTRHP